MSKREPLTAAEIEARCVAALNKLPGTRDYPIREDLPLHRIYPFLDPAQPTFDPLWAARGLEER